MLKKRKEKLRALFLERGIRASKIAEKLNLNKATVYDACNPNSDRYVSESALDRIENYLNNPTF